MKRNPPTNFEKIDLLAKGILESHKKLGRKLFSHTAGSRASPTRFTLVQELWVIVGCVICAASVMNKSLICQLGGYRGHKVLCISVQRIQASQAPSDSPIL